MAPETTTVHQQFDCHDVFGYAIWEAGIWWDFETARGSNSNWFTDPKDLELAVEETDRYSGIKLAAWVVVVSLVALALLVTLVTAGVNATILVDQLPTADYGTPTSPALESFYGTITWSFLALIGVVTIGIALPFIISFRRRKKASYR